jgi:Zn-finger nucleic acid-binding protein
MGRFTDAGNRFRIPLKPVLYEGVEIDVDPATGGVWLDAGELKKIVDLREKSFTATELAALADRPKIHGVPQSDEDHQRPSPVTGSIMTPVNYGGDSGIIIDRCPDTGGVWLDAGELEKVQQLVESWQKQLPADQRKFGRKLDQIAADCDAADDVTITRLPVIGRFMNTLINDILDLSGH